MTKQLGDGWHLSLSIGKALWDDLVGATLPLKVKDGGFELGPMVHKGIRQLQVKEKVVALLEDRQPPAMVIRAKDRAAGIWRARRERVYALLNDMVRVEGDWLLQVDREGTEFHYAPQKIGVDAHVKAVAHGKAFFLRNNVEIPFTIEKRLGATCHLGNIRYDKDLRAVVGDVVDPEIDFGDHVIWRLLNEAGATLLAQQVHRFNPVSILKKDQVDEMVSPAGGPLKLKLGVEDVMLEVTEDNLTLKVRFGFTQLQITEK